MSRKSGRQTTYQDFDGRTIKLKCSVVADTRAAAINKIRELNAKYVNTNKILLKADIFSDQPIYWDVYVDSIILDIQKPWQLTYFPFTIILSSDDPYGYALGDVDFPASFNWDTPDEESSSELDIVGTWGASPNFKIILNNVSYTGGVLPQIRIGSKTDNEYLILEHENFINDAQILIDCSNERAVLNNATVLSNRGVFPKWSEGGNDLTYFNNFNTFDATFSGNYIKRWL